MIYVHVITHVSMCEGKRHAETLRKLMRKTVAKKWNVLWKREEIYEREAWKRDGNENM